MKKRFKRWLFCVPIFFLLASAACSETLGSFSCPVYVLDSQQSLPEPSFKAPDPNADVEGTTYFEEIFVRDRVSGDVLWNVRVDPSFTGSMDDEFFYGEDLEHFTVVVEAVPLEENGQYILNVDTVGCRGDVLFDVDEDGRVIEMDD